MFTWKLLLEDYYRVILVDMKKLLLKVSMCFASWAGCYCRCPVDKWNFLTLR